MQNNWVLLQGRLCHRPNYTATKKGLHKVAFRLSVPRSFRTAAGVPPPFAPVQENLSISRLPAASPDSDFVTVIIIGKPAWEFKQLNLQAGASVRVQGRLRSWDLAPDQVESPSDSAEPKMPMDGKPISRRDYRLEVIAEKVDPLDDVTS